MLKIRKNNGVTLIILIVTIIVLLILAGIAIEFGGSTIKEIEKDKATSELSLVQSAIFQRYNLLKSKGQSGKIAAPINSNTALEDDEDRPTDLIGTRLATTNLIISSGFNDFSKDYNVGATDLTYEEYYYWLDKNDVKSLGLENDLKEDDNIEYQYIVNYSTGEVFDLYNKRAYTDDTGYLGGRNTNTTNSKVYNFVDDNFLNVVNNTVNNTVSGSR